MGEVGHNSELTDGEKKALFFSHFQKIQAKKAELDAVNADYRKLRKDMKADGFKLADLDFAMRAVDLEDDSIIPDEIKSKLRIMEWLGMPVGHQSDLFSERRPADERANAEGFAAGMQAAPRETPYGADSPAGQSWLGGYDNAQAEMREQLKSAMEKKNSGTSGTETIKAGEEPFPDQDDADDEDGDAEERDQTDDEWDAAAPGDDDGKVVPMKQEAAE